MAGIRKTTIVSCSLLLIATAASAQRQWTATGQEVPEIMHEGARITLSHSATQRHKLHPWHPCLK